MKLLKLSFACVALLLLLTLTACDGSEADAETSHDYHIWYDAGYEVEPECAFDGTRRYTCECGEVRFETVESRDSYIGNKCENCQLLKDSEGL